MDRVFFMDGIMPPLKKLKGKKLIMQKLLLLIYLYDDPPNDLISRIRHIEAVDKVSLLGCDGVTLLSNNAILFDQTKSHDSYVRVCRGLIFSKRPYFVYEFHPDDALAVGKLPKEVQASLSMYGVHVLDKDMG
jgi:hypothetical protein